MKKHFFFIALLITSIHISSAMAQTSETWDGITIIHKTDYDNNIDNSEINFFVASNWDPNGMSNYETSHNWNTFPANWTMTKGSWSVPHGIVPAVTGSTQGQLEEAYISSSKGYILQDLQESGIPITVKPSFDNKAVFDFIFRLDNNDYSEMSDDNTVYDVEFWATTQGSTNSSLIKIVHITPRYYDEYVNCHNFTSSTWTSLDYSYGLSSDNSKYIDFINSEQKVIKNFPTFSRLSTPPTATPNSRQMKYAVIRAVIDLGVGYSYGSDGRLIVPTGKISKVNCRLNSISGKGIFVRGLRARTKTADDLLRGK